MVKHGASNPSFSTTWNMRLPGLIPLGSAWCDCPWLWSRTVAVNTSVAPRNSQYMQSDVVRQYFTCWMWSKKRTGREVIILCARWYDLQISERRSQKSYPQGEFKLNSSLDLALEFRSTFLATRCHNLIVWHVYVTKILPSLRAVVRGVAKPRQSASRQAWVLLASSKHVAAHNINTVVRLFASRGWHVWHIKP